MSESAKDILDRRLASGEIALPEYNQLLERLSGVNITNGERQIDQDQEDPFALWKASPRPLPTSEKQYRDALKKADLYLLGVALFSAISARWISSLVFRSEKGQELLWEFSGLFSGAPEETTKVVLSVAVLLAYFGAAYLLARIGDTFFVPLPFVNAPSDVPAPISTAIAAHNAKLLTFIRIRVAARDGNGVTLFPDLVRERQNIVLFFICIIILAVS